MNMRNASPAALLFVALLTPTFGHAQTRYTLDPASTLSVSGGSSVRSWKCSAKVIDSTAAGAKGLDLASAVKTAQVRIPVEKLDCANGTMEGHLQKALNAKTHPNIEFALGSYTVGSGEGANHEVRLNGDLTINGQTRPISTTIRVTREDSGALRAKGEVPLDMTTYGVQPPTLMMGTLKVHKDIKVAFDLTLAP